MTSPQHILIVEDEENLRHMLVAMLAKQGYCCDVAENGAQALPLAGSHAYDFILCDIRMPVMDGKTFLAAVVEGCITTPVIMMSAYGTVDTAIECMKMGAYDFISKPFKKDEIVMVLKKAEERERLKHENSMLKQAVAGTSIFCGIISRNPVMQEIFGQIGKVAGLKTTVLILGESGTGKELVAKAIHDQGNRCNKPFVAVNCAAIPENLLESELFGHVRGAFTDAMHEKAGLFEQADGGTLFLDEIGEMPPSLQVKLLRVLQEEEIRRVGSSTSRKVDVRVISATSRDLAQDVKESRFREDLYFRINVFGIQLPPLRERVEDIPMLAEHFALLYAERLGLPQVRIAPEAMRRLVAYDWPGNIREMENVIERGMILCEGCILLEKCLPDILRQQSAIAGQMEQENLSIKKAEAAMEQELIRKALARTNGNRTHAARILEISHRSLLYKLKEMGIE